MSEIHAYRITCGCLNCLREKDRRIDRNSKQYDAESQIVALTARLKEADQMLEAVDAIVEAHWNDGDVRFAVRNFERVRAEVAKAAGNPVKD